MARDTGIRIDAETAPHIFERFAQAERVGRRPVGGLGLGLAIVRHLVELHGGTVRATALAKAMGQRSPSGCR